MQCCKCCQAFTSIFHPPSNSKPSSSPAPTDSLLATYASSDEDDDEEHHQERAPSPLPDREIPPNPNADWPRSLLSSLPPPKSSHLHLPPPKSQPVSLSSGFSAVPPPESAPSSVFSSILPPSSAAKKVVQFRPPLDPSLFNSLDDDDDDDENLQKRVKKEQEKKPIPGSGPGRIASFLPPPQHLLPPAPSGRRTAVDAGAPVEVGSGGGGVGEKGETVRDDGIGSAESMGGYYGAWGGGLEGQLGSSESGAVVDCGPADAGYYTGYADYGGCWDYGGAEVSAAVELPAAAPVDVGRIMGKRGRDGIPLETVEVKQEELVKDRPREDKLKATGIAFGPAYQPVSSSGKGKPSKLHRRKHQIGSLYFDMKQKESELMERRAKGMLTKKETQGKYGW